MNDQSTWTPTHRISLRFSRIPVQVVGKACYTRREWIYNQVQKLLASQHNTDWRGISTDWAIDDVGKVTFLEASTDATIRPLNNTGPSETEMNAIVGKALDQVQTPTTIEPTTIEPTTIEPTTKPATETQPKVAALPKKPKPINYRLDIGLHPLKDDEPSKLQQWRALERTFHSWDEIEQTTVRLMRMYFDEHSELALRLRRIDKHEQKNDNGP